MKEGSVVVVSFGLLASLCMAPTAAADSRFHGPSAGMRLSGGHSLHAHKHLGHKHGHSLQKHGFGHQRLSPHDTHGHSFHKHGFGHHRFFRRHFVSFGVVAPSAVLFSSPPIFLGPPLYYSAPVYAPPVVYGAPVYSPPAPPPAVPRVVEYPTGRYELRGDGVSTPYTWVWIPNPPPPPPAPPTAPPAGAPTSGDAPPARQTQLYRWVDEEGVVHWTDRLDTVPRRYREKGKALKPS